MKSGKKKVPFGGRLLIYMTVMFTVIFVAMALWWHYLSCYESARVAGVMDAYMTRTLSDQLQEEMYAYSIACKTEYQSEEEVYEVLSEALSGDDWHYEKDAEKSTQEHPVFTKQLCQRLFPILSRSPDNSKYIHHTPVQLHIHDQWEDHRPDTK